TEPERQTPRPEGERCGPGGKSNKAARRLMEPRCDHDREGKRDHRHRPSDDGGELEGARNRDDLRAATPNDLFSVQRVAHLSTTDRKTVVARYPLPPSLGFGGWSRNNATLRQLEPERALCRSPFCCPRRFRRGLFRQRQGRVS